MMTEQQLIQHIQRHFDELIEQLQPIRPLPYGKPFQFFSESELNYLNQLLQGDLSHWLSFDFKNERGKIIDADQAGIEQIDLHRHGHWSIDTIHFDQLCAIHWISLYFSEELKPFIETYTQPPTSVKPKQKLALILTLLAVLGGIGSYLLQDAVGIVLSVAAFFLSLIWYGLLQLRQYFANKQPQQFERTFVISRYFALHLRDYAVERLYLSYPDSA